jgi:penicillin amidase
VPVLLAAADRRAQGARAEVGLLRSWNFVMKADQAAPAIYEAWLGAVRKRLVAMLLPSELATLVGRVFDLETIADLVKKPDASFGPRPEPARDSLVLAALDDAMSTLSQSLGADVSQWKWGDIHLAPFKHAFVSEFDLKPARRGGDGTTVNATAGPGFEQTAGASFREIIDLSNWDNSWVTSTPGQSGQPGSPHYGDLLELWRNYEYFPLAYSRVRVEKETLHVMQLVPAGR